ncbi:MAG: hypothetical protein EOM73_11690, partial [Bacteroidia bacterium]|nr:hypothetical protein [Bacteroidia bacterium]
MKFFLFTLIILLPYTSFGGDTVQEVIARLDEAIDNREYFVKKKIERINQIKAELNEKGGSPDASERYEYYKNLSNEYLTLKFDSAFVYTEKLVKAAYELKDADKIAYAKTELANILISAGIFNESLDTLRSIPVSGVSKEGKAFYYTVLSRGYFDMESFSQSLRYASLYREKGMACYDSAMACLPAKSWEYLSLSAQKNLKLGENEKAIKILDTLIYNYPLTNDQIAIQLMSLAFTCNILGNPELALKNMAEASIADFRGAKKEAVALLFTANYLFERGDVIRASKYINVALEDSRYYGSNFRLWQVSQFLPFIKSEHIVTIEKQKHQLWLYAIVVTLLIFI